MMLAQFKGKSFVICNANSSVGDVTYETSNCNIQEEFPGGRWPGMHIHTFSSPAHTILMLVV